MLSPAESGVPEMQELQGTTHDGVTLTFWYRAACNNQPTIVYFHGNKGNLSGRSLKIKPYLDAGFGVLLGAYRGYGHNSGKPNELGLYSDARAQLSFLKSRGIHSKNLILYGESLGSGVAVNMAFEMAVDGQLGEISAPVGGLILEAPFSSSNQEDKLLQLAHIISPVNWLGIHESFLGAFSVHKGELSTGIGEVVKSAKMSSPSGQLLDCESKKIE